MSKLPMMLEMMFLYALAKHPQRPVLLHTCNFILSVSRAGVTAEGKALGAW